MNQNTKTSNFLEAIKKYANQQKEKIEQDAQRFRAEKIEQATEEGLEDAYRLIQNEISKRKTKIITEYASKENKARTELFEMRKQMLDEIRSASEEKLIAFTRSDAYPTKLISYAKEADALFEGQKCVVSLSKNDMDKALLIKECMTDAEVTEDDHILLGGIKVFCQSKGMIADLTYDSKLTKAMNRLIETSGLEVV